MNASKLLIPILGLEPPNTKSFDYPSLFVATIVAFSLQVGMQLPLNSSLDQNPLNLNLESGES